MLAGIASGMTPACNAILGIEDRPPRPDAAVVDDSGGTSAYAREVMKDGPVVYFRFGETNTSVAHDEKNLIHGTYPTAGVKLGVPGAIAGDPNTAVEFDGTAGIAMQPAADFDPVRSFTVEVWVRIDDNPTHAFGFIVDHETFTTNRAGWELSASDQIEFDRWANDRNGGTAAAPLPSFGQWHHIVATFDTSANGYERIWIDGAVAATAATSSPPIPVVAEGWTVGAQNCECRGNKLRGAVDELAIYPVVLPEERILAHYAAGR